MVARPAPRNTYCEMQPDPESYSEIHAVSRETTPERNLFRSEQKLSAKIEHACDSVV